MPDLKGVYKGNCNRKACQKPNAIWFNTMTNKYYCPTCASRINKLNGRICNKDLWIKDRGIS